VIFIFVMSGQHILIYVKSNFKKLTVSYALIFYTCVYLGFN